MQIQGLSSIQAQSAQKIQSTSPLQNAAPGDKLMAEVTSSANGRVTLTLPDGTALSAGQQASEALLEGDRVELEVQNSSDKGTTLRLISVNGQPLSAKMPALEYALMRAHMPASGTHMALARVLNDLGLPLSMENLSRMGDIVRRYPDLPPAQAAIFAASDMPLTDENIRAFSEFVKQPLAVTAFAEAVDALISQNPAAARILTSLQSANGVTSHNAAASEPLQADIAVKAEAQPPKQLSAEVAHHLSKTGEWPKLIADAPSLDPAQARDALLSLLTSLPRSATAQDRKLLADAFNQARAMPEAAKADAPAAKTRAANAPVITGADAQDIPQLNNQSRALPLEQVVKSIFALIERGDGDAPEKLKESASSLNGRVLALSGALQQSGAADAKGVQQLGNTLSGQLQMGGELHNLLYAQIPFALNPDDRQTAELYVLKRGSSKRAVDEENATIALCLETEHIGRLETLLRVEQNEMSLQFRVENEKIQRYVKNQLQGLKSMEFPAQYRYSGASVMLQKDAITPLNAANTMREAFGLQSTGMLDLTV